MRAADDFVVIRARMEQLQRERLGRCEAEQRTARTDAHVIGASTRKRLKRCRLGLRSETGSGSRNRTTGAQVKGAERRGNFRGSARVHSCLRSLMRGGRVSPGVSNPAAHAGGGREGPLAATHLNGIS